MIIRRMADAVRTQNWFTVVIEIFVVVIGIFLGLQVTEWNDSRKDIAQEKIYLQRMRADMVTLIYEMEQREAYFTAASNDNKLVIDWLNGVADLALSPQRLLTAFYNSTVIYPFTVNSATYQELVSTGNVGILRDVALRQEIARYFYESTPLEPAWNIASDNAYRNAVRAVIPYELQSRIAGHCEPTVGNRFIMAPDCVLDMDTAVAEKLLAELEQTPNLKRLSMLNHARLGVALRLYSMNKITAADVRDML